MDRQKAAAAIRKLLEARVVRLLGCEPADLSHMRIGSMAHFLFLLVGDSEVMPGFNSSFRALLDVLGNEIVWEQPKTEEAETPKVVVN